MSFWRRHPDIGEPTLMRLSTITVLIGLMLWIFFAGVVTVCEQIVHSIIAVVRLLSIG